MLRQKFHLVHPSPWPALAAFSAFMLTFGTVLWMHGYGFTTMSIASLLLSLTIAQWARDVIREATFMGCHTSHVMKNLRTGMALFILSEAAFFFSFFWAFFHSSLAPSPEIGSEWPPTGITPIDPMGVPLLNTAVLLTSGVTITVAHHSLIAGNRETTAAYLFLTSALGLYFTYLQAWEYYEAPFTIADGIYGSTFFVTTGFHGLHVIIGTTLLIICLLRTAFYHFSQTHHVGFEASAWYWHFVDVVWILLYLSMYCWGSL